MENKHSELVKGHFDIKYKDYDTLIKKLIPKYEEMHDLILKNLHFKRKPKIRVLDLGIGTGKTSLEILKKFPDVTIDGVDISKNMIKQGKQRLRNYLSRVNFMEQDIAKLSLHGKYDAVVSVLCIHHLNQKQKKELFYKIFNLLKERGILIIADIVKFDSGRETTKKENEWKNFLIKNLGKKEGQYWFDNYKEEDLPDSVNNQLKWLKKAGFKEEKEIFKHMNYTTFYGKKWIITKIY